MRKFGLTLAGAAGLVAALISGQAYAVPAIGAATIAQNSNAGGGVFCTGNLAVGVTCNNAPAAGATGILLWDGGNSGAFTAITPSDNTPALEITDTRLTSTVGQTYSFTSSQGNFTGMISSVGTNGTCPGQCTLSDFLSGTFTPSFGGFTTASPGSLTIAYTETAGVFSVSETLNTITTTTTPEPASLALLGAALVGFGVIRRRRKAA